MSDKDERLESLGGQNEQSEMRGLKGYWVQADCVFVQADNPTDAIDKYRDLVTEAKVGISHNHFCDAIKHLKLLNSGERL